MSVTEQEKLIEDMAKLEEKGQTYLLGVMAGLVAMQESKEEKRCGKCGEECEQIADRTMCRIEAMNFFMRFVNAHCQRIAIENPTGVMSACYRQPDQTIQPYYFAESIDDKDNYATKKTGLWLKGLEPLKYKELLPNPMDNAPRWGNGKKKNWTESNHGGVARSKTFPGVAKAMAEQWG